MEKFAPYAKALAAALAAAIGALLLVITGTETFADVTVAEWLLVALTTIGSMGLVYAVPNR